MKVKILLLGVIASSLSSCSGLTQHSIFGSKEGGYVSINADAAGMQALGDWNTGLVTTGKASPDVDDSHHELRRHQESQKTMRIKLPTMNKGAK